MTAALKYDQGKLPWDLLPVKAVEGMLRVLQYGRRKYTTCGDCEEKIYSNARLDGALNRQSCSNCGSKNITTGDHNWRKGFSWSRLIAAAFRHLSAILQGEDVDPESGELHTAHLMCCVAFLHEHMVGGLGTDDRYKKSTDSE